MTIDNLNFVGVMCTSEKAEPALTSRSLNVLKKSKKDRRMRISGPFLSGRNLPQRVEAVSPEISQYYVIK
jgi:hypothetical protein